MFGNTALIQQNLQHVGNGRNASQRRYRAAQAFWQAYFQASLHALWARLMGRNTHLESLHAAANEHSNGRRLPGVQIIPISQIRGSEGRSQDFDVAFRPRQPHNLDRWVNIAVARDRGVPLPPVDLIQVGHIYYVRDGHHRISVAHIQGQADIEAHVTVW
ncbi:MAG TPA: hypothetical protein PLD25_31495 [Chloroflexota bacterium]|nr:hypothetical protein [Chloroflexota bacterium]